MDDQAKDQPVLNYIQRLVEEEHRLYTQGSLADAGRERLTNIEVEPDQCWDLLRQRRALRDAGRDPNEGTYARRTSWRSTNSKRRQSWRLYCPT